MIIDAITGLERYLYLNPRFEKVFQFLRKHDLHKMEEGLYEIDGEAVYATISEGEGKKLEEAKLEVHDSYIDIQVAISGGETFGWRSRSQCDKLSAAYDVRNDIAFYDEEPEVFFTMEPGNMAIFFPHDAHAPMIGEGKIRKIVIKVRV